MQESMMGSNIIITEPSSNLRALGRNALAGKWQSAIIAVIVYMLCLQLPVAIFNNLFGVNVGSLYMDLYASTLDVNTYNPLYSSMPMPSVSPISGLYTLLVSGPFELGISLFFLALFRRQIVGTTDIFLGFEKFGKAFGLMVFQSIFIALWTCLFVVPGIIAAIRYSQAFFILADDPTKSIRQCMNESKIMMKGNKAKYFCLTLSFIGWALLSAIPESVLQSVISVLGVHGLPEAIGMVISQLFIVPVTVYIWSTYAGFYEILAGHLIKEAETVSIEPEVISTAYADAEATEVVEPAVSNGTMEATGPNEPQEGQSEEGASDENAPQ